MKILLADDSMTAQNMGKKILTEAGYEVVAVSNGAAAVKKIAEHRPDVAVLDVYMPGYTGLEVCERLKTAHDTTHMPVLLTVGRMEPFKPEEGNRVKADGIIIKPFEASDLLAAIQKIEQRLGPARRVAAAAPSGDPTTIHEKTQKIAIPYQGEFKDASYEEWKVSAPGHVEEGEPRATVQAVPAFGVPEEMQATPAFGMDELEIVPPAEADPQRTTQILNPPPVPTPVAPAPPAAMPRTTARIEHKTEVMPPAPTPQATPDPAPKSISGVWRALDKARDWFGGAPEGAPGAKLDEAALPHISDLPEEKLAEAFSAPPTPEAANTPVFEPAPLDPVADASPVADEAKTIHELAYETVQSYGAVADPEPAPPANELMHTSAAPIEVTHVRDPHLELAPKVSLDGADVVPNPDLEPTVRSREAAPTIVTTDPALVTDVSDLASSFPTRFGVANPEDVPVGVASNFPHLYADALAAAEPSALDPAEELEANEPARELAQSERMAPATPMPRAFEPPPMGKSAWVAEEEPLEDHESDAKLHDEMHQAFAGASTVDEEAMEVELVEPGVETAEEASSVGTAPDPELAAAMAAAVGAQMAPSVAHAVSHSASPEAATEEDKTAFVADIVQRVVDMMKPELIRRISSELGKKK
jgi:CheY-like chemotaxis protein